MFGRNLAKIRKEKNLSQYKLAERMNLSRGQIANYEQGSREPDFNTLKKFADFFEVSIDYLLGEDDELRQNLISKSVTDTLKKSKESEREISNHLIKLKEEMKKVQDSLLSNLSIDDELEMEKLQSFIKSMDETFEHGEGVLKALQDFNKAIDTPNIEKNDKK